MELPLKESLQTEGSSATPCVHISIPDDAKLKRLGWATNCLVVFWVLLSLFLTLHVWSCFCVYLCFFWLTLFCLLFLAVFFCRNPFTFHCPGNLKLDVTCPGRESDVLLDRLMEFSGSAASASSGVEANCTSSSGVEAKCTSSSSSNLPMDEHDDDDNITIFSESETEESTDLEAEKLRPHYKKIEEMGLPAPPRPPKHPPVYASNRLRLRIERNKIKKRSAKCQKAREARSRKGGKGS